MKAGDNRSGLLRARFLPTVALHLLSPLPEDDQCGSGCHARLGQGGSDHGGCHAQMEFARKVSKQGIFMNEGWIIEITALPCFFATPQSPRSKAFLSKILTH